MSRNPDVAMAVLNWGLGHATRSAHLLSRLENMGYFPLIVSSGAALKWLSSQFPHLPTIELSDPDIRYGKHRGDLWWNLFQRGPAFLRRLQEEKACARQLFTTYPGLQFCISDHCLGFYHPEKPSVLVAHQLHLPVRWPGLPFFYQNMLKPFQQIWVPDVAVSPGWSGKLSHPSPFPEKTHYIGLLPHFRETLLPPKQVLILLSGPEPQRSLLEEAIVAHWPENFSLPVTCIRGTDLPSSTIFPENWTILHRASSEEVSENLRMAAGIIGRNGYTTLMDLAQVPLPALFIPTPGQPEQAYLAQLHASHPFWNHMEQHQITQIGLKNWLASLPSHRPDLDQQELSNPDLSALIAKLI